MANKQQVVFLMNTDTAVEPVKQQNSQFLLQNMFETNHDPPSPGEDEAMGHFEHGQNLQAYFNQMSTSKSAEDELKNA
jgi:hypothetical protein